MALWQRVNLLFKQEWFWEALGVGVQPHAYSGCMGWLWLLLGTLWGPLWPERDGLGTLVRPSQSASPWRGLWSCGGSGAEATVKWIQGPPNRLRAKMQRSR